MSALTKNRFSLAAMVAGLFLFGTYTTAALAGTISKSNGSIILRDGQSGTPDLKTVNGRIEVGDGLHVGQVKTTNGSISLGADTVAEDVRTTNGGISVDEGSKVASIRSTNGGVRVEGTVVAGDIRTTNGAIKATEGTQVKGSVLTTNGGIVLDEVKVDQDVRFTNGKMVLEDSFIGGDVVVNESRRSGWFNWGKNKKPIVVIGPNTEVKGDIIAMQEIELHIHESAKVGDIEGAEAEYFSGNRP